MTNYIPVEGSHGLYRDSNTSAIINKDKNAYKAYLNRKKAMETKNSELDKMKEDLDNVRVSWEKLKVFYLLLFKN